MNLEQFSKLLEAYGTRESNWPEDLRGEAARFASRDDAAGKILARHTALDRALDRYEVRMDTDAMASRILGKLPRRPLIDRLFDWLLPEFESPGLVWRPALVAALPLAIGIIVGSALDYGTSDTSDNWDEEIYLLALDSGSLP